MNERNMFGFDSEWKIQLPPVGWCYTFSEVPFFVT